MRYISIILFSIILMSPSCPPRSPEFYYEEGIKLTADGKNLMANRYFSAAINTNPEYLDAYVLRAANWMKEDSFDRAIEDYSKIVELRPNGETYYKLGDAYWRSASGRDSLACKYFSIAKDVYNHNKSWDMVRMYCK